MTTMAERQAQYALEQRRQAGLPVIPCPECGVHEPHWVPESLDEPGGYFTCQPQPAASPSKPLFDLTDGARS